MPSKKPEIRNQKPETHQTLRRRNTTDHLPHFHTQNTGTGQQPSPAHYELRYREDKLLLKLEMAKPGSPEAKAIEDELSMYRQLEAQQNYIMSNRQQSISQMKASLTSSYAQRLGFQGTRETKKQTFRLYVLMQ